MPEVSAIPAPKVEPTKPVEKLLPEKKKDNEQNLCVQTKLIVGAPDDPYEKEADSVAESVMRAPQENFVQRKCAECEKEEKIHRQVERDQLFGQAKFVSDYPFIQRRCTHCDEETKMQRKPIGDNTPSFIQTKSNTESSVSNSLSSSIQNSRGNGSLMDNNTQSFMENRMGADFSSVKIHTGKEAVQMNKELNAQAFTVGSDVYFNEGKYQPHSSEGKQLLAHELTHVVQQNGKLFRQFIQLAPADCGKEFLYSFEAIANAEKEKDHRGVPRLYYTQPTGLDEHIAKYYKDTPLKLVAGTNFDAGQTSSNKFWRAVCFSPAAGAPKMIYWVLNEYISKKEIKPPDVKSKITEEPASAEFLKPGWTEIHELGIPYKEGSLSENGGVNLRRNMSGAKEDIIKWLPINTKLFIISQSPAKDWYAVTTLSGNQGEFGYVNAQFIWRFLPDPESEVKKIKKGDTPIDIASAYYSPKGFNVWGKDSRYVVNALAWVNKNAKHNGTGEPGIKKPGDIDEPWFTAKATADVYIWLPGAAFMNKIYETVAKYGGGTGSLTADMWRSLKAAFEYVEYGIAFVGGLIHGFVKSLYDAIAGLVGLAVDVIVSVFTLNVVKDIGDIIDMFKKITWDDIKNALADWWAGWEKKLMSSNPWVAGHAHGYLTGYIMAEAAQLLLTGGILTEIKAGIWGSRFGKALQATNAYRKFAAGLEKAVEVGGKGKKALGAAAEAVRLSKPFQKIEMAVAWVKNALWLTKETIADLSLDAINELRKLPDWVIEKLRHYGDDAKRFLLRCYSPCKVNIDAIIRHFELLSGKASAAAKKLTSIDEILAALPAEMEKSLIRSKLKSHPAWVEAIKKAGLTDEELKIISEFLTGADKTNAKTAYETFTKTLSHLIPAKVGPDITKFNEIAELLVDMEVRFGSAVKGPMFENFIKLHGDRFKNIRFGRATFSNGKLAKVRTSDGFIDSTRELWEFKHTFEKVPADQLKDYKNIMALGIESAEGATVKSVNYVFPTKEAAELNKHLLSEGFKVFFFEHPNIVKPFI
jgi:hypothetical protein